MDIDVAEGYKWWMEMLSPEILALEMNEELDESECKAVDSILKAFSVINDVVDNLQNTDSFSTMTITTEATLVSDGSVGWPKFDISELQLRTLLEENFSVPDIAKILGVSVSTIRCQITDFDLSVHQMYTKISSEELQRIIGEVATI